MINRKELPIPVATVRNSVVYFCLKPSDGSHDGYISEGGVQYPVFVYTSYERNKDQNDPHKWKLIDSTEFHKQFWEMPSRTIEMSPSEWIETFIQKSKPISDELLGSLGMTSSDVYGK